MEICLQNLCQGHNFSLQADTLEEVLHGFTSFSPINDRNYESDGFFSEMIEKFVVQTCFRIKLEGVP